MPWNTLASDLKYSYMSCNGESTTNLYPRFKPGEGNKLEYLARGFVETVNQFSKTERAKFSEKLEAPTLEEKIITTRIEKKIRRTIRVRDHH
jgi:hypothetical protein